MVPGKAVYFIAVLELMPRLLVLYSSLQQKLLIKNENIVLLVTSF